MANSRSGDGMIDRTVRVLETFTADRTTQSLSELSRRSGLPLSTTHRIVEGLVAPGLLERDDDRRLRLGPRLWELALRGSRVQRLRQAALPHMQQVQAVVREHTQLAVLEDDEALFLERLSHPDAGANITRIAGRLPLHASSAGLVLLAYADAATRRRVLAAPLVRLTPDTTTDPAALDTLLDRVRREGGVVAKGTVETVSTGVAVPVIVRGEAVAALAVVLPRGADVAGPREQLVQAARRTATDLEAEDRKAFR